MFAHRAKKRFWGTFTTLSAQTSMSANLVPDAHIVALMREHGVRRIWTRDRDIRKFDDFEAIDPFSAPRRPPRR